MLTRLKHAALLASLSSVALLAACQGTERIAYRSDAWSPKTVTLLDTRTGENVVTIDVPVGKQLNLWFQKSPKTAEIEGADSLHYSIRDWGDGGTTPGTVLTVPPPTARRIDVTLRKTPEQPGS